MKTTENYRELARTCIVNMIKQLTSAMQHYNNYAGKDNRSAGLYNNEVQQLRRLLSACGFKPNITQAETVRNDERYLVYESIDFEHHSIHLRDLGVTDAIGNSGDNTRHKFTY